MPTLSIKSAYDEVTEELKQVRTALRQLEKENADLLKRNREIEQELWQVWQDFHRVVYLLPDESSNYAPLRRLWDKYSELNQPWEARDYDAIKDNALTDTGSTPY